MRVQQAIGLLVLVGAVASCGGANRASPSGSNSGPASDGGTGQGTVVLKNFQFVPAQLSVAAGTTIRFDNDDSASHTVTEGENGTAAAGARFDQRLDEGKSANVTFAQAGSYRITCRIHPTMNMSVTVR